MPRNPNIEPKPFALIPISTQAPDRKPVVTHEKFTGLTGRLELSFTVASEYLFVGSGAYEFDPNARGDRPDVWYTFYRRNGKLCVPGTSIKGAIRAIVEAISNSCVSQIRRSKEEVQSKQHQPCRFDDEKSLLCPACRLFGATGKTGYRGRVHFSDFLPESDVRPEIIKIGELWEPRRYDSTQRRFYERKRFQPVGNSRPQSGFRFVEAVPRGTKFRGTLTIENVSEAELGLVFYAFGWEMKNNQLTVVFVPKLGGAKPRCLGSASVSLARIRLWNLTRQGLFTRQEIVGQQLIEFSLRCLQECRERGLLHLASWNNAVREFASKTNPPCPGGLY
jgi:CRISPR/Cas system CSM-associated protein Csm3 (group 7 of RAMP superfamily)